MALICIEAVERIRQHEGDLTTYGAGNHGILRNVPEHRQVRLEETLAGKGHLSADVCSLRIRLDSIYDQAQRPRLPLGR